MTQTAKAQEPSMEEILASIRRIIADDDASKPAKAPETAAPPPAAAAPSRPMPPATPAKSATAPPPAAKPTARPAAPAVANSQDAIDAMLAELDGPPHVAPQPAATQPAAPAADVLDLTEAMAEPSPSPGPAPTFRTIDGTSDVVFSTKPEPPPDRALISNETIAAVDSAFNTLAHTVIGQNARTLEDLVREMLRPMLKSWLDDNLPSMVERIVRAEIERVSRGRP
jgi:cell pole-organizing protein PopZ